jgi:hypothetical protein
MTMARALKGHDPKTITPSKPKVLIFGAPGVGKTWTSLEFPSVYYIDTEGGADLAHYAAKLKASGAAYMGPDDGANDFKTVIDEVQTLATTDHPYKTLVLDSFSKLMNTQIAMTGEQMEKERKEDAFGASKKPAVALTRRLIAWLDRLDMNVILICHERALWRDGKEVGQTFDGYDKLMYELHLALHITKQGASRKAKVVKSRLESFPDAEVFDWSYAAFADRYGKSVMEAASKKVELASAEQIKEYNELLGAVKVEADVMDKWNAACENVAELESSMMLKRIAWLRSKLPK